MSKIHWKPGRAPYGWKTTGKKEFAENPSEQYVIGIIMAMDADGFNPGAIAEDLADNNIRRRDDRYFDYHAVRYIIKREEARRGNGS